MTESNQSESKSIVLNVLKKNRKYFACTKDGYKCKLIIDDSSKDLSIGEHTLVVFDKSVRTKYGTDLIYQLAYDAKDQESAGIVTLRHQFFNQNLVDDCRNMGGKWDADSQTWVFSDLVADRVEELDAIYNSDLVPVEITAIDEISEWHAPVRFMGYTIARAWGRDSGAKLGDDVSQMKGNIDSGGSVKNWRSKVSKGSVFRLYVPKGVLELHKYRDPEWEIKIITKGE